MSTSEVRNSPNTAKVLEIVEWLLWAELCFSQICYVEAVTLGPQTVTVLRDKASKEVIKLKWWTLTKSDLYRSKKRKFGLEKKHQGCTVTEEWLWEDTVKRHISASLEEKPQRDQNLLTPWSWILGSRTVKK